MSKDAKGLSTDHEPNAIQVTDYKYAPNATIEKSIEGIQNEAYNLAIDHAIKLIEQERGSYYGTTPDDVGLLTAKSVHTSLIIKFKALKK